MPNAIFQRQSTPHFTDLIAASSQAYGVTKSLSSLQTVLALATATIGPAIAHFYPSASVVVSVVAVTVLLSDVVFIEPAAVRYQQIGAKIQELFDTELFELPWNNHLCDSKPDLELCNSLASKFKSKNDTERLHNWYPEVASELPLDYGRLVCQRANMRWDSAIRTYFSGFFVFLTLAMVIGGITFAAYHNMTMDKVLSGVVLPLLPAGIKLLRQRRKHRDSAAASDRTKSILERVWVRAVNEVVPPIEFVEESRRLQDEIYDRRRQSPPVPQKLYFYLRSDYERDMRFASAHMVDEARRFLER